jgi:hypothetical protein
MEIPAARWSGSAAQVLPKWVHHYSVVLVMAAAA